MDETYKEELRQLVSVNLGKEITPETTTALTKKVKWLIFCASFQWVRLGWDWISSVQVDWFHETIDWFIEEYLFLKTYREKIKFILELFPEVEIIWRTDPKPDIILDWDNVTIDYEWHKEESLEADYISLVWTIAGAYKRWTLKFNW